MRRDKSESKPDSIDAQPLTLQAVAKTSQFPATPEKQQFVIGAKLDLADLTRQEIAATHQAKATNSEAIGEFKFFDNPRIELLGDSLDSQIKCST